MATIGWKWRSDTALDITQVHESRPPAEVGISYTHKQTVPVFRLMTLSVCETAQRRMV
jgi:hypothetical protein